MRWGFGGPPTGVGSNIESGNNSVTHTHHLIHYYFSNDHWYKALDWFAKFKEEVKESEKKGRGKGAQTLIPVIDPGLPECQESEWNKKKKGEEENTKTVEEEKAKKEEEEKTKKEEEENAVDKGILDDSTNRKKLASYLSHFTSTSTRRRRKRNFASSLNFIYELIYEIII